MAHTWLVKADPHWLNSWEQKSPFFINISSPPDWNTIYCSARRSTGGLELDEKTAQNLSEQGLTVKFEKDDNALVTEIQKESETLFKHVTLNPARTASLQNTENLWYMDTTEHLTLLSQGSSINIWDASTTPTLMKKLDGHLLDVNVAKFFPSGKVVLSGGADMLLKVWSLENDGTCAAMLKGHKRGITGCDFIDRGRNVVSSSKDGTAILWNTPSQEIIHSWKEGDEAGTNGDALNDCFVFAQDSASKGTDKALDERDFGTEGHLLLCCGTSGLIAYDMRMRTKVFSSGALPNNAEQNATVGLPQSHHILCGGDDGATYCWDLRNAASPLATVQTRYKVTRLLAENERSCWIASSDGSVSRWDIGSSSPSVTLIGNSEPIYGLTRQQSKLVTASRRSQLHYYAIN